jgi:hypothetical protein
MAAGFVTHRVLVEPRGRAFDFFPIWFGVRRIWQGQNPYSLETTAAIQRQMFGSRLPAGANQLGFAYPLYLAPLIGPLAALPFSTAVTVWCTAQFCILALIPLLAAKAFTWNPERGTFTVFSLATLFLFRYPVIAFVLGQFSIFILACTVLGLYWLRLGRGYAAGAAFAFTLIKPNVTGLLVLAFLGWSLYSRRWKAMIGLVGTGVLLVGFSFCWQPTWIRDYMEGLAAYASYANVVWPLKESGDPWLAGGALLVAGGIGIGALANAARTRDVGDTLLAFCLLVILSLMILPQTGLYSLSLLLLPGAAFLALAPDDPWTRFVVLLSLATPWLYWGLGTTWTARVEPLAVPLQFALAGGRVLRLRTLSSAPGSMGPQPV